MDIYEAIVALRREGRSGALVTLLARSGSAPMPERAKMLVLEDGTRLGTVGGGAMEERLTEQAGEAIRTDRAFTTSFELTAASDPDLGMICGGKVEFLVEPVSCPPRVLIVGAGHVGGALARVLAPMDLAVTVTDDREHLLTPARLPGVTLLHARTIPEAFAAAPPGRRTYVVVTARSHELEMEAVRLALATPTPYVGVLGSARKASAMRDRLGREGGRDLHRLRSPVGIPIGADDPAEIAVSIAAEIVSFRRTTGSGPEPGVAKGDRA